MLRRCKNSHLMSSERVVLPFEVIEQVLSFLPVKSLLQLRCVCKSWKILISDPLFVKLHLKRSARNPRIILFSHDCRIFPFPVHRLLDGTISIPHADYPVGDLVGSYNGLVCFFLKTFTGETLFYLWNPATKTLSKNSSFAFDSPRFDSSRFAFGYDNSAHTYKIVAYDRWHNKVKVFNFGDNVCRDIGSFLVQHQGISDGVYVSNAINWLAIRNGNPHDYQLQLVTIDQFVIISLDLSTETYRELSPPPGFTQVTPNSKPTVAVLMDSLCFSHDFNGTHLVIWHMEEFGVHESWTQFYKISYHVLPITNYGNGPRFFPLWLSKNGDTLILTRAAQGDVNEVRAILYNLRDNLAVKIKIEDIQWCRAKDYVESLAPTCSEHKRKNFIRVEKDEPGVLSIF